MEQMDMDLYQRIESGDQQALEQLYDRYEKLVFSFSYRITNSETISEEVVQEVFMNVWKQKGSYQADKGKFSSWLLTVTRNKSIDMLRKRKGTEYTWEDRDSLSSATNHPSSEELLEWKEEGQSIRNAINKLPLDQQKVVDLFYFGGLTQNKIAEKCNIPLGTVKGRIRLALRHLKQHMTEFKERGESSE